jgi:hypothetical protein
VARRFLRLADLDNGVFERLGRYEAALWRKVRQTLFTPWKHYGGELQTLADGERNNLGSKGIRDIKRSTVATFKRNDGAFGVAVVENVDQATAAESTTAPISWARSASFTRIFTGTWRWALARGYGSSEIGLPSG